jgi:hypothetical protein
LFEQIAIDSEMIDYTLIELELILEEVARLPVSPDTCGTIPDVLYLVYERLFYYETNI